MGIVIATSFCFQYCFAMFFFINTYIMNMMYVNETPAAQKTADANRTQHTVSLTEKDKSSQYPYAGLT